MERRGEQDAATTLRASLGKFAWAGSSLWGKQQISDGSQVNETRDVAPTEKREGDGSRDGEQIEVKSPSKSQESLECNFDSNPTELYLTLLRKDWESAVGRSRFHVDEAKTWVSRMEENGTLRWRLLPIHAAIIFKAPEKVIEALLEAFPSACQQPDDQGMLPIHLAFRNEATERSVNLLLEAFPGSVDVKDRKGRTPMMMVEASNSANRDMYMRLLVSMSSISDEDDGKDDEGVDFLEENPSDEEKSGAESPLISVKKEPENAALPALAQKEACTITTAMNASYSCEGKNGTDAATLLKNKGMELVIEDLKEKLEMANGKSEVLDSHIHDLEDALTAKSEERRSLHTKVNKLDTKSKQEKETLEKSLAQVQLELQEARREMENMKRAHDDKLLQWVSRCMKVEEDNKATKEEARKESEALLQEKALLEAEFQEFERNQLAAFDEQIDSLEKTYEERIEEWKMKLDKAEQNNDKAAEWESKALEWKSKFFELEKAKLEDIKGGESGLGEDSCGFAYLEKKIAMLVDEKEVLQMSLDSAHRQYDEAKRDTENLKGKLEKEIKKREERDEKMVAVEAENRELMTKLEGVQSTVKSQFKNEEDQSFLAKKNKELRTRLSTLEAEVKSRAQLEDSYKDECSNLYEENESLRTELKAARDDRDAQYVQVENLRSKISGIQQVNESSESKLQQQLKDAQTELVTLREQVTELQQERDQCQSELYDAMARNDALSQQMEEMIEKDSNDKDLRVQLITLEADARNKTHEQNLLRTECAKLREETVELRVRAEVAESRYRETQKKLDETESGLRNETIALQEAKDSLEVELKLANAKLDGITERSAGVEKSLREEKQLLQAEKEALQKSLTLADAKYEAANKYLDEMEHDLILEINTLQAEKERLTEEAQTQLNDMEAELMAEVKRVQGELDNALQTIAELGQRRDWLIAEIERAEQEQQQTQSDLAEMTGVRAELEEKLEQANEKIAILEKDYSTLNGSYKESQVRESVLTLNLKTTREENMKLNEELQKSQQLGEELSEQHQTLKDALSALEHDLNVTRDQLDEVTKKLTLEIRNKAGLEAMLEQSEDKIDDVCRQLDDIEEAARNENSRLFEEKETLAATLENTKAELKKAQAEMEEFLKKSQDEIADLELQRDNVEESKKAAEAKCNELEKEKEEVKAKFAKLEYTYAEESEEMQEALHQLQADCAEAEVEAQRLAEELEILDDQYSTALQEIDDVKSKHQSKEEEMSAKVDDATKKMSKLSEDLAASQKQAEELQVENDETKKELSTKASELSTLREELIQLTEKLQSREATFESTIQQLHEENADLNEAVEVAESKYIEASEHITYIENNLKVANEDLWEENQSLVEQISTVENKLEEMQIELCDAKQQMEVETAQLMTDMQALRENLETSEAENTYTSQQLSELQDAMKTEVETLEKEKAGALIELEQAEMKVQETLDLLEYTEKELRVEIAELTDQKESLEEAIERTDAIYREEIQALKSENANLADQIEFWQNSVAETNVALMEIRQQTEMNEDELHSEVSYLTDEKQRLLEEARKLKQDHASKIRQREERENALISENAILKDKLDASNNKYAAVNERIDELKGLYEKELQETRTKLAKCTQDIKTKKEVEASLLEDNKTLASKNKALQVDLELAQVKCQADNSNIDQVKKICEEALKEMRIKVYKMEEECNIKKKNEANLKAENTRLRQEIDTLESKLESLISAHNQINQELSKLKLEYGSLSLPEAGNQSDVEASLRKQISKLVAELESFRGAPEDIDTNKEGVTTESLRKEIMIVRQHYSAAQQQLEEMKQNHEKLRRWSFDVMKSGKENSTLKAEWASAQARAALAEAKVKSLTEQNNDLVSLVTKSRLEVQQKKQILDDLKQELNSQILCVAKVLEDMAEHQQINVNEVSDLQLDMTKAAEARTEEIFQKAAEKSKKVANMLRQQGRRVGDHMEKYQAILMRWSKSVESASAAVKDGDKTETQDAILSTNDEGCKEGAAFKDTAAEPASTSSIEQPDKEVVNYNKEDSDFVMPEPESEQTGATGTETECKEGAVFENTAVESVSITSSMEQSDKKVNNCDKEESDFAMPESEQTGASGTVVPAYYHPEVIEEEAELDEEPEVEDDESDRDDARADAIKEETETEEPTESIDEYDNEHRAGVIPLENEIEMFHNPYTPGTPCG